MPRFQVSVSDELNEFVEVQAKSIGISKSAYVATLLDRERKGLEAMVMTNNAKEIMDAYKNGELPKND